MSILNDFKHSHKVRENKNLPVFYHPKIIDEIFELDDAESKHCHQVLRKRKGQHIKLLDGQGGKYLARLTSTSSTVCKFEVLKKEQIESKPFCIHLAIAPTKNRYKMEWLVEKCTEIGVDKITFIQTENSERSILRMDRLEKKVMSTLKQSGNPRKTELHSLLPFEQLLEETKEQVRFIAFAGDNQKHLKAYLNPKMDYLIAIGPEGDFTDKELALSYENGFQSISLGQNILRTETAGLIACSLINFVNGY